MQRYQLFFLIVLSSIVGLATTQAYTETNTKTDCDDFVVELETKNTVNGGDGELILTVNREKDSHTINIFGEGHSKNRLAAKDHEKNLTKGEYIVIVQDNNGCSKMLKALIK